MEIRKIKGQIEAILFSSGKAVPSYVLAEATGHDEETIKKILRSMMDDYDSEERGIHLIELDGSFQLCTKKELYEVLVKAVHVPKKFQLTESLLEVLSIVAYKQPVTRGDIDRIRGVKCDHAVNKLIEYGLIEEVGRLQVPGRPLVFGTTKEFLRHFGIASLSDLPKVQDEVAESIKEEVMKESQMRLEDFSV